MVRKEGGGEGKRKEWGGLLKGKGFRAEKKGIFEEWFAEEKKSQIRGY